MLLTNRRFTAAVTVLLFLLGLYLAISWAIGYTWAGIWKEGVFQNAGSIVIGLYLSLAWLGFLLATRYQLLRWIAIALGLAVVILLGWDQFITRIFTLRADVLHLGFAIAALLLTVFRGRATQQNN
jgi:hypothetical protein